MATAVATPADLIHSSSNPNPSNGEFRVNGAQSNASSEKKKSRESERRRRRRKQKKNKNSSAAAAGDDEDSDAPTAGDDSSKENNHPNSHKVDVAVEVEYVPEKADVDESFLEDFKSVFEKFSFTETAPISEEEAKKEEASDAAKKKLDSDSDEEEQEGQQKKEGAISNKKKKMQRRMKIAELKQICSRPDVVEVWDVTSADPKLLVFLKSYRNTVPVPRHWCQKRKFLQGWR